MAKVIANWNIELNTVCPHCKEYVDLMKGIEDWDDMPECGHSKKQIDKAISCPECNEELILCETTNK